MEQSSPGGSPQVEHLYSGESPQVEQSPSGGSPGDSTRKCLSWPDFLPVYIYHFSISLLLPSEPAHRSHAETSQL